MASKRRWLALVGISVLSFVVFIDFTIVNVILPGIQRDLQASVGELQWMINGFILMLTMFMVTMGRLGDIYGRRRMLYIGVLVFAAASILAGVAPSSGFLIACRIAQGTAGAIILTCGASLVPHHFAEAEQGRAMAIFMSITGLGMAIGPVVGGLFISFLSWRWAFYVNIPVVLVGFAISWRTVEDTPRLTEEKIDWPGLALLVPGMGALVTAIMQSNDWGYLSPVILGLFALAIVSLAAFVRVERRVASPIIDFALLGQPLFLACIVAGLALGGFIAVGNFLPPLYLQNVRNEVPYVAGLMMLPISGLVVLVPQLVGGPAGRIGPRIFIAWGLAILTLAALVQFWFQPASPVWFVLCGLGLFGLGWGLQQSTTATAATSVLPPAAAGLAMGALWTFWNVGSNIGLAVGGLIFEEVDRAHLLAALAREKIALTPKDQELVRSLLSDPSQAKELLGQLTPGLEAKILPLFQEAFMAGYSGAMVYLAVTCALAAILFPLIARRAKAG